jgi:peptidyl-prolyl cis-trans isomerase D
MAEGTVKRLEGPAEAAWFVTRLDDIEVPELDPNDPLIAQTRQQLATVLGSEYSEQFVRAAMAEVGTKKNQAAIDAVRRQLNPQAE